MMTRIAACLLCASCLLLVDCSGRPPDGAKAGNARSGQASQPASRSGGSGLRNQQRPGAANPRTFRANLSVKTSAADEGLVIVSGTTNLPDGAKLLVSLSNSATSFLAQDTPVVRAGKFTSAPLGPESGLRPAKYEVEVMMSSRGQPKGVLSAVGRGGANLSGKLIKRSFLGEKEVDFTTTYTVGSERRIARATSERRRLASKVRKQLEHLLEAGRAMATYRESGKPKALQTCGEMMRKHQREAEMARALADRLPNSYINLKLAAVDLETCVSCADWASKYCESASRYLRGND